MGKPTPEGARDFLVPTRLQPGRFFALPQSPQIYKQLLVISGFERYYQIARCFRDEDLRADRLQELTQLDVEMAFPDQDYLFGLIERIVARIWRECRGVELETPFPRMTWEEADLRYGSDKPDLRFGLEIEDATDVTRGSGFRCSRTPPRCASCASPRELSRGELAKLEEVAKRLGREGARLPRLRAPTARCARRSRSSSPRPSSSGSVGRPGRHVLFGADEPAMVSRVLGALRLHLGRELELIDEDAWRFLWVTDFPMFEWDPELERWDAVHHPFTRPNPEGERPARHRPGRGQGDRLRPRRQRRRARRRLVPDPRGRPAGEGLRPAQHLARGAAVEVRVPARRARDGRAAARRHRVRDRPAVDDAARRAVHPRHARVPEEPGRRRPDVRRADAGRSGRSSPSSGSP